MTRTYETIAAPSARWNTDPQLPAERSIFRVLTVEGDGIHALVSGRLLVELEQRAGASIADLFDGVVGTSGGAILALGVTAPSGVGDRPAHQAAELVRSLGPALRFASDNRGIGRGLSAGARHSGAALTQKAKEWFGDLRMSDALRMVGVPTYDLRRRVPVCLASDVRHWREPHAPDVSMVSAAIAATSLPGRLPPILVRDPAPGEEPRPGWHFGPPFELVGGTGLTGHPGLWARYLLGLRGIERSVLLVSLGGGKLRGSRIWDRLPALGPWRWRRQEASRIQEATLATGHMQLDMDLNVKWGDPHHRDTRGRARTPGEAQVRVRGETRGRHFDGNASPNLRRSRWTRYLRFDPTLGQASLDPFDLGRENRAAVERDVDRFVSLHTPELSELAETLCRLRSARPPRRVCDWTTDLDGGPCPVCPGAS